MSGSIVTNPTPIGSAMAILAGLVATSITIGFSAPAAVSGLVGLILLFGGLLLPRPGVITSGAALLALGVLLAGLAGAPGAAVGIGFVGVVVAWDVAHNSLSHGRQVGRDAPTVVPEAVHAGASLVVGLLATGFGYGVFVLVGAGQPATAVALLTLGAVILILAVK